MNISKQNPVGNRKSPKSYIARCIARVKQQELQDPHRVGAMAALLDEIASFKSPLKEHLFVAGVLEIAKLDRKYEMLHTKSA